VVFYDISFEGVMEINQLPLYKKNCFDRRTNDDLEFITDYAKSRGSHHSCEKYRVAEDFAESFSAYVASGKHFRMAAKKHPIIAKKYQWLKNNVFEGVEYDTDLIWGNASGCNDAPYTYDQAPGYMSCKEDYIWDGLLQIK
jgi:hypothetical protein